MSLIRISAISYLNTLPFLYGLKRSEYIQKNCTIDLDIPSVCAERLCSGQADIGIVPVAIIPKLKKYQIISDYCIGSVGNVKSVLLLSEVPLHEIKKIILDYQSRTSVVLVRILAAKYWLVFPEWEEGAVGYETDINNTTAAVVIGDRAMELSGKYKYLYDLSSEWTEFTGLPFVFACWVSVTDISSEFQNKFNEALKFGISNISDVIREYKKTGNPDFFDLEEYYTKNVSYNYDSNKKKAMDLFMKYASELE